MSKNSKCSAKRRQRQAKKDAFERSSLGRRKRRQRAEVRRERLAEAKEAKAAQRALLAGLMGFGK